MKKFLLATAALCMALSAMAQDFSQAVETFNNAAQTENKTEALALFQQAYTQFQACQEAEAAEKVEELKNILPTYTLSIAKDLIEDKNNEAAIPYLEQTAAYGQEFGLEDKVAEAKDLTGFVYKRLGKNALAAKDAAGAFSNLKKAVEFTPADGEAQFLLGRLYMSSGKMDEAKAAFAIASENGQAEKVQKQLFNFYYIAGQKKQQAKQYAAAVEDFQAALEADPSPDKLAIYYKMGICYGALGKKADQNEALKKYCELDAAAAANDNILLTIAQNAVSLKDNDTAREYYTKLAGSANPDFAKEAKAFLSK